MFIDRAISAFIVHEDDTILSALARAEKNSARTMFCVSQGNVLRGVVTGGDLRRWIVRNSEQGFSVPISTLVNTDYVYADFGDSRTAIMSLFTARIHEIPLVDENHRLIAVAIDKPHELKFGNHVVSKSSSAFVVAEIGNNHQGDLGIAKRLVDEAVAAGADCAKFQMRDLDGLFVDGPNKSDLSEDLGAQYVLDLLRKYSLSKDDMFRAFDYCRAQGIEPLCTPWDLTALNALEGYGLSGYKIASADLTNHQLLRGVIATSKPFILSTGMSNEEEIQSTISILQQSHACYALLHCCSTYPTPYKDVNLRYMDHLRDMSDTVVGYSGHERGYAVPIAAVARGAKIIEKHITLDKTQEGNDHRVSLLPSEFKDMVAGIRAVEASMGAAQERVVTQGELLNREVLAKSIVASRPIRAGESITKDMILIKSPGKGLQPSYMEQLLGRKAKRDLDRGEFFFESDISDKGVSSPRPYRIKRRWGIPVRFHDYKHLIADTNPSFLEFHLSYKDIEESVTDHFEQPLSQGLLVHAPELFQGDHILDLAALEYDYRSKSIDHLQQVIDLTRRMQPFFPSTDRPAIVVNVGGHSEDGALTQSQVLERYDILAGSLATLDREGVELLPQTMPPYPWHFGGQRYHNLFVDSSQIRKICEENDLRICLDVSHSKLACNTYKWSFDDFLDECGGYAAHIHIADARGVDGEGLQLGDGDLDIVYLRKKLDRLCSDASMIPEIWQGHKNNGEGFWEALAVLEDAEW